MEGGNAWRMFFSKWISLTPCIFFVLFSSDDFFINYNNVQSVKSCFERACTSLKCRVNADFAIINLTLWAVNYGFFLSWTAAIWDYGRFFCCKIYHNWNTFFLHAHFHNDSLQHIKNYIDFTLTSNYFVCFKQFRLITMYYV